MKIEISIPEACEIITEHFKNKGYFINNNDMPVKFKKVENPLYSVYAYNFSAIVSITGD